MGRWTPKLYQICRIAWFFCWHQLQPSTPILTIFLWFHVFIYINGNALLPISMATHFPNLNQTLLICSFYLSQTTSSQGQGDGGISWTSTSSPTPSRSSATRTSTTTWTTRRCWLWPRPTGMCCFKSRLRSKQRQLFRASISCSLIDHVVEKYKNKCSNASYVFFLFRLWSCSPSGICDNPVINNHCSHFKFNRYNYPTASS